MSNYVGKQLSSRPVVYQNLSYAGSASVPSTNFGKATQQIRVVSDVAGYLVIGDGNAVSATAQSGSMKVSANVTAEYFTVTGGQMAAFISTSTSSGNVSITEVA